MILRQSTAVDILIGPFVDEDDGKTLEESLTISQGDVMLSKNGQPMAQKNDNTACAFDDFGSYNCELDATDTNTVGILTVTVFEDGALPFRRDYQVIEEAVYDILYAASATGAVPVASIAANAITATAINADALTAAKFAADVTTELQSGLATAAELAKVPKSDGTASWNATALAALQSEANDALVAYDPPTKAELDAAVANVSVDEIQASALADLFNTDSGTTYASAVAGSVVAEIADNAGGASLTVQDIVDGVWDEPQADHADAGTFGETATEIAAILVDTGITLQGELDAIEAAVITNAAGADIAADIIAIKAETAAILTDTAEIGAAGAGLTAIDLPNQTMNITGNITGNLSGTVGSVTGAVGSVTGAVGSVTGLTAATVHADLDDIQARLPAALTGDGNIKADMLAVSGDITAADRLEALMDGVIVAQVNDAAATTTAFIADGFTEATNDHFNGRLITFISGALSGQQTAITDYTGATQTFTCVALTEAPAENDFFVVH